MGRGLRFLLAPNPFKGSLSAAEVAAAMAQGLRQQRPVPGIRVWPLADGGPGTLQALRAARGGRLCRATAAGPYGLAARAAWLELPGKVAVIESAQACGLHLPGPLRGPRQALAAHSQGVGDLLLAAQRAGMQEIWLGLGGSACSDGGTGMARVLGWHFLDARGGELALGGGSLARLAKVIAPPQAALQGLKIRGLCDARNPLCGGLGAARVYGPQKGASPAQVKALEAGLQRLARFLPKGVARWPGAGAAGGLGAGLMAFCHARLVPGADTLLDLSGFDHALKACDWVITGEGHLDSQSLQGKLPLRVAARAKAYGKPCLVVAGRVAPGLPPLAHQGVRQVLELRRAGIASRKELISTLARWAKGLNPTTF
jgi:glycerate kinase